MKLESKIEQMESEMGAVLDERQRHISELNEAQSLKHSVFPLK